ncbi:Lrp/AsnC ligand binding domain-containing protein [Saxibacter everestensis]|uniref:Lrp/AsnC ligand binding domain-containing protein n=1 Tax=Saxibacter everestensis TaxID=2909229 RepID=A0ABY8QXG5_9MICO|nr:Lrp/AsnC ligand binding domain-containing protein [Brevibacteriaceae bacterium ZFBP1038]
MITAIVLISTAVDHIPETASMLAEVDGVSEVYSVTGDHDLIALVRVSAHEQLATVISDKMSKVPGVVATTTHIAFKAYSKHDLEAAFDIGLED